MPSVTQLIRSIARNKKVQQYIIEKDYALSYLLAAIATTDGLRENLVLKGGTALKKLYFPEYRFSEDLDYSTRVIGPIDRIDALMETVVLRMAKDMNERGPFQVGFEPFILRQPHPGDQKAYTVHVQFPEQRQALCRLKVEITVDEPILSPTENRLVHHDFAENFHATASSYSLVEITAEKLRALLQSKARLQARGWGAGRVCRDYYDLWNLLQLTEIKPGELIPLLDQKCALRGVSYKSPHEFIAESLLAVASSAWQQQLLPFVPYSPPVTDLLNQVQALILSVWE
jgi:predicted nucleotidyltransferase component of viral defense system